MPSAFRRETYALPFGTLDLAGATQEQSEYTYL